MTRFAHGMTVATNALLEGNTARTALLDDGGVQDVIELGRQNRPHLYRLCEPAPRPLVADELRFGVHERVTPEGVLQALHPAHARELALALAHAGPEAVAICLLHSYADPGHERLLSEQVRELLPGAALSLSSELVGTFREYERTATTVLDASLSPLLSSYLGQLSLQAGEEGLPEPRIMQSSGGLTDVGRAGAHAGLTVLSGPAGGVGGASLLAGLAGERDVLCLDMGGTSCDVCLIDRRRCRRDLRAPDRRAAAGAAGAGHPDGRRRRRVDRLARRRRRAARRVRRSAGAGRGPPATGAAASSRR